MARKRIRLIKKTQTNLQHPGQGSPNATRRYDHTVKIKYPSYRRWPIFAALLALCSCSSVIQTTRFVKINNVPGTATDKARPEQVQHIQPANLPRLIKLPVFGYSYRPDRKADHTSRLETELNSWPDLTCDYQHDEGEAIILNSELCEEIGSRWPEVESGKFQYKFNDRWQLAADMQSRNTVAYTEWYGIPMPLPHLTYASGAIHISTIYMPSVQGYNLNATMGIYFTITL
jgi:hypothetical protein